MATTLNIVTRDAAGTALETIVLNSGGAMVIAYPLLSPEPRSMEFQSLLRSGTMIGKTTLSDIAEPLTVLVQRGTDADLLAFRQAIERAFITVARRQERKRGPRVFVEFQADRLVTLFRSELKRGQLLGATGTLDVGWRTRTMEGQLAWLRRFYWEAAALTELPLRSKATAKATGGVSVANTSDATYGNWIEILGSDLPGVLPAPLQLQLTNSYGSGSPLTIYVGQNIDAAPTTLTPILEGEAATWFGTSSTVANAAFSAGNAKDVTWAGDTETHVATWTLSQALLGQLDGAWVHLLARLPLGAAGVTFRFEVRYLGLRVLATTDAAAGTAELHQRLGALQLPPRQPGGTPPDLDLRLYVKKPGGGTLRLDAIHLLVADSYTEYGAKGFGLQAGTSLIDNAIDGVVAPLHFVKAPDDGLLLRPQTTQRLTFVQSGNGDQIDRSMSARAWYRERRITL